MQETAICPSSMPSLSIVIPVFKQPNGSVRTIAAASDRGRALRVRAGRDRRGRRRLRDTGRAHGSPTSLPLHVLDEERPGRFAARQQGIEAATGELVLLLDSRIAVAPTRCVSSATGSSGERDLPIWSAHFEFNVKTPYGRFWSVIIPLAWWRYYSARAPPASDSGSYDRYPKSTTCFLAPRALLLEARTRSTPTTPIPPRQRRHRSDPPARRAPADQHLSPLRLRLHPHETYRAFMHNVFHRGKTFIDSYGRPGTRFFPLVLAYFPLSLLAAALASRRPRLALKLAAAIPLALRRRRRRAAPRARHGGLRPGGWDPTGWPRCAPGCGTGCGWRCARAATVCASDLPSSPVGASVTQPTWTVANLHAN